MQISKRLKAVAALVTSGGTVADIGTDHAYIPIYLIQTNAVAHVVAMDVNRGPLARAREHIAQYGLAARIETRLSDGLAALCPGEADCVVIAGMGGPLTVRILEDGRDRLAGRTGYAGQESPDILPDCPDGCRELILQPQSEIRLVRMWLDQNGWRIVREDMVCEDGKFYPMMRAERSRSAEYHTSDRGQGEAGGQAESADAPQTSLTDMELRFGPLLLREHHPVLKEFLLRERELDRRILASLEGRTGDAAAARAEEVRRELRLVEAALAGYGGDTVRA